MTLAEGLPRARRRPLRSCGRQRKRAAGLHRARSSSRDPRRNVPDNLGITSLYTKTAPARVMTRREATIVVATSSNVTTRRVKGDLRRQDAVSHALEVPARAGDGNVTLPRGAGKLVARVANDDRKIRTRSRSTTGLARGGRAQAAARRPRAQEGRYSAAYFFVSRALAAAGVTRIDGVDIGEEAPKGQIMSRAFADIASKDVPETSSSSRRRATLRSRIPRAMPGQSAPPLRS